MRERISLSQPCALARGLCRSVTAIGRTMRKDETRKSRTRAQTRGRRDERAKWCLHEELSAIEPDEETSGRTV